MRDEERKLHGLTSGLLDGGGVGATNRLQPPSNSRERGRHNFIFGEEDLTHAGI
jgi:hypothetical protein